MSQVTNESTDEVFNKLELLEQLGGDQDLVREVILLFLEECPTQLAAIKSAKSVQATYQLFEGRTGQPVAVLDGTALTLRKTAAEHEETVQATAQRTDVEVEEIDPDELQQRKQ